MVKEYLLDESRKKRIGLEEAIFCENKTLVQIVDIIKALNKNKTTLFTKLKPETFNSIEDKFKQSFSYDSTSCTAIYGRIPVVKKTPKIAVICAGTSDMPTVLEAKYTLLSYRENCDVFPDLGVAGLWRIQAKLKIILKLGAKIN